MVQTNRLAWEHLAPLISLLVYKVLLQPGTIDQIILTGTSTTVVPALVARAIAVLLQITGAATLLQDIPQLLRILVLQKQQLLLLSLIHNLVLQSGPWVRRLYELRKLGIGGQPDILESQLR